MSGRIFDMSFESGMSKKLLLWILGVFILLFLLWWGISFFVKRQESTAEPVARLRYCGAELQELCILSFGRDVDENLVINLYVPERDYPDFKLNIKRRVGESAYECQKFPEVPTSVFCYGEMISLQERMEVSLVSVEDESLLAYGNLTLEAILVSGQFSGKGSDAATPISAASEDVPDIDVTKGTGLPISETQLAPPSETATSTPEPSYPNPSYP